MISHILIALLLVSIPILAFLMKIRLLDNLGLIPFSSTLFLLATGALAILIAVPASGFILQTSQIDFDQYSLTFAPIIEESLKALPIILMFHLNRLGYKIDAGISGLAVGAGFALAESSWIILGQVDANLTTWLIRGLGTALMHGGSTAIFALITHEFSEWQLETCVSEYNFTPWVYLPGLAVAAITHTLFNLSGAHIWYAVLTTLVTVPLVLYLTFHKNAHATSKWLTEDAEKHRMLLREIQSGAFSKSHDGQAIREAMRTHPDAGFRDAIRYFQTKTQLVLDAEELILGLYVGGNRESTDKESELFAMLDDLEILLGRSYLNAMEPYFRFTRNDIWELERFRRCVTQWKAKLVKQSFRVE